MGDGPNEGVEPKEQGSGGAGQAGASGAGASMRRKGSRSADSSSSASSAPSAPSVGSIVEGRAAVSKTSGSSPLSSSPSPPPSCDLDRPPLRYRELFVLKMEELRRRWAAEIRQLQSQSSEVR
jgi:hypothetical protein